MRTLFLISLGCLALLSSGGGDLPSDVGSADELFQKQEYQAALNKYEAVLAASNDRETQEKAFYRSCQCLAMLKRFGEATELLLSREVPEDMPYKARSLMLKAELLSEFSSQYSWILRRDVIEEDDREVFRLTPDELKSERAGTYPPLWELRADLASMAIREESYFIDTTAVDSARYPTALDYVVSVWTDALLKGAITYRKDAPKPDARLILADAFAREVNLDDPPGLLVAEILEATVFLRADVRQEAIERWRIARLLLPLHHQNLFNLAGLAGDADQYSPDDLRSYREGAEHILLAWLDDFRSPEAKAAAGYEAAIIMHAQADYVSAAELCRRIADEIPGTGGARLAEELRANIEAPAVGIAARTVMPPGKDAFTVNTRNVKQILFCAYQVEPWTVKKEYDRLDYEHDGARDRYDSWGQFLSGRWLDGEAGRHWLVDRLYTQTPDMEWSLDTGDRGDYQERVNTVSPPALNAGLYLVVASAERGFRAANPHLAACFLNVTDLVVIGNTGPTGKTLDRYYRALEKDTGVEFADETFRFYAFDAGSGKPVRQAHLVVGVYPDGRNLRATEVLDTDTRGRAGLSTDIAIGSRTGSRLLGNIAGRCLARNEAGVDLLAHRDGSFAYWSDKLWFAYNPPHPIRLLVETDRPIYQPGDRVHAKVVAVRSTADGFRCLDGRGSVTFRANDPNHKKIFEETTDLGGFGSASISFDIPRGRLLGRYELEVVCAYRSFNAKTAIDFSVEEYKRPEFEIELKPADRPWKYGEEAKIEGKAAYYFGGPVPEAEITYRMTRSRHTPYWWGQSWEGYSSDGGEIAQGKVVTDSEGNFTISFTPAGPKGGYEPRPADISRFAVKVEGHDSGGRTIEASREYRAGATAIYMLIEPAKGFFSEGEPVELESRRLTMNDTPAPGAGDYQVFLLSEAPPDTADVSGGARGFDGSGGASLDVQIEAVPNGEMVAKGSVVHDDDGKALISVEPLPQGTYRLVETSHDQWGVAVTHGRAFVVTGNRGVAVPAPSVTLVEKDEYEVGETAKFIIGSCWGSGTYHLEIWAGEHLIGRRLVSGDKPFRLVKIRVTQRMKGGFTLRWFGVKNLRIHSGQADISVPWRDKQLQVALQPASSELAPGQTYTWKVSLTDRLGRPVRAEALALMYDRSLEYYATGGRLWLETLYGLRTARLWQVHSVFKPGFVFPYADDRYTSAPRLPRSPDDATHAPSILLNPRDHARVVRIMKYSETIASEVGLSSQAGVVLDQGELHTRGGRAGETGFFVDGLSISDPFASPAARSQEAARAVEARTEFRDAVFFEPHIVTSAEDGTGTLTFTAPEQVTSWRVKVFAFTKDVAHGKLVREVQTKKHMMVRADLPRFFREGDHGTVTAVVHNESEGAIAGDVFIDITENGTNVNGKVGLSNNGRTFSLEPHGVAGFDWSIVVPQGVRAYRVRVAAVSDTLSDAEERDLPVLPSRERLIESACMMLSGSETKRLGIDLRPDPTRINESMVLEIEPELALTVLNTIPFLVQYPYECVEQTLNKYVPLSIISEVYKQYPAIQQAVGQIPKRNTPTPPWQADDPRRLTALMETPWVWQSEGRPVPWPLIDLLDPENVRSQAEISLSKLTSAQLPSGAFPWWPGGRPDLYMTLYVLEGLAEARPYGVEIPQRLAEPALDYVVTEIPRILDTEADDLALVSLATYVLTSYPADQFPRAKKGHALAREWVAFLDAHTAVLGPFSKARLAYTHFNLGNHDRAQEVLNLAMDGAREDAVAGVYWTPEKYSWVWYSDTVEKHAFLLRALQQIRPDDQRIPGMIRWLLFNRKGTVWKSTKASVAAVYAILDFLREQGALESDDIFEAQWGGRTYSAVVKPDQWLAEPLRWQGAGPEITPAMSGVEIEKVGPGLAFASLTWTYSTDEIPEASEPGMLALERRFYRRVWESGAYHLKPIESGDLVQVGDQIEVQLKVNTRAQFEYMHLKDPKAAGFEAEALLSGWKYDALSFYQEPRHSLTNFFMSRLPHGEYILRYRLRPTKPGTYRIGAATLQSMYAPEMTAHSAGFVISVAK